MAYFDRRGDIIAATNEKAGALTMSVPLLDFPGDTDPVTLWNEQAAIRTVVGAIAKDVSTVPLHVYRMDENGNRERVRDSKLARTIAQPIPNTGQARWVEQLVLDMAIYDRWAVRIDEGENRATLGHIPASYVAVLTDPFGVPEKLAIAADTDSGTVLLDMDRVAFDVGPTAHPKTRRRGAPRLTTMAGLSSELKLAAEWRSKVLANGAWVPAVIERPLDAPKWDDDSFERFRASFANYRSGGGQAGGTPILEDGMKLQKADVFDPKDFDTAEMRQVTLIEACLLFHYPPELLGARPGTYSNIEAFREQKYVDTLGSWITNIEQALNAGLAGLAEPGEYIEAHVDAKLRGAFHDQAQILQSSTGRPWMTTNEARKMRNMPPVEGGDELVTPLNVTLGGLASPRDTAPPQKGQRARRTKSTSSEFADLGDEDSEIAAYSRAMRQQAAEFADLLVEAFHQPEDGEKAGSGRTKRVSRLGTRRRYWHPLLPDYEQEPERWDSREEWELADALVRGRRQRFTPIMMQHAYRLAQVGALDVINEYGHPDEWDSEDMLAWIQSAAENNAEHALVNRMLVLADSGALRSNDDYALKLLRSVDWIDEWTTTTATEAVGFGGRDAARAIGLMNKTWVTTSKDPRTSHAQMNGVTVPATELFPIGLDYPGERRGLPSEYMNCQCRMRWSK